MSILTYNGNKITQRDTDGYVNATEMCQANGKQVGDWLKTQDAKRYIDAISTITNIPVIDLVLKIKPDINKGIAPATWVHPKLAIKLARWISVDFELWCDEHIRTLITTGQTQIIQPTPEPQPIQAYTIRVKSFFENTVPAGYWCVFVESSHLLIWVEQKLKLPVAQYDLLDGSIGAHWAKYRQGKEWADERIKFPYKFPDGRRCHPWCYPDQELLEFRKFANGIYKNELMPVYLESKYGKIVKR